MPLIMQQWNIYRSRAIGHWLQENGVPVIPNIRFGNGRTFEISCAGIQKHGIIATVIHENYNQQNFNSEHMRKWVDYTEYVRSIGVDIDFAEGRIDE